MYALALGLLKCHITTPPSLRQNLNTRSALAFRNGAIEILELLCTAHFWSDGRVAHRQTRKKAHLMSTTWLFSGVLTRPRKLSRPSKSTGRLDLIPDSLHGISCKLSPFPYDRGILA